MYPDSGANKLWVYSGLDVNFIATSRRDLNEFRRLEISRKEEINISIQTRALKHSKEHQLRHM